MTDREKLPSGDVERVAETFARAFAAEFWGRDWWDTMPPSYTEPMLKAARAALSAMPDRQAGINEGLEMAAKVADQLYEGNRSAFDECTEGAANRETLRTLAATSRHFAAAIRAMKVEK